MYAGGFIDEINWTIDPETVTNIENKVQQAVTEVQNIDESDLTEQNLELIKSQMWITPEIQVFLGYILSILILFQIGVIYQKKMLKKQYLQFSGDAGEEMMDMIRKEVDAAREVDRLEIRDIKETISNH